MEKRRATGKPPKRKDGWWRSSTEGRAPETEKGNLQKCSGPDPGGGQRQSEKEAIEMERDINTVKSKSTRWGNG